MSRRDPDVSPPWFKMYVVPIIVMALVFWKILESLMTVKEVIASVPFQKRPGKKKKKNVLRNGEILEEELFVPNPASHSKNSTLANGLISRSWSHLTSGQSPTFLSFFSFVSFYWSTMMEIRIKGYLEYTGTNMGIFSLLLKDSVHFWMHACYSCPMNKVGAIKVLLDYLANSLFVLSIVLDAVKWNCPL